MRILTIALVAGLTAAALSTAVYAIRADAYDDGVTAQKTLQDKAIAAIKLEYDDKAKAMRTSNLRLINKANERTLQLESSYSQLEKTLAVNDAKVPKKLENYVSCKLDAGDMQLLKRSGYSGASSGLGTDTRKPIVASLFKPKETDHWYIAGLAQPIYDERKAFLYRIVRKGRLNRSGVSASTRYQST